MATNRKSSARSSGSRGRKPSSRRRSSAQQRAQHQMQAVILFASGIFLAALTLIKGASAWNWLHNALFGLFGAGAICVSAALIYIAILLTTDKPFQMQAVFCALLVAFFCGALQIFQMGVPESIEDNLLEMLVECIIQGIAVKSGGLVGAIIGLPLLLCFGKVGAGISIVLLIFVFLMLVTGGTLVGLAHSASKPVRKIEETYASQMELQEQRRAKRAANAPPPQAQPARKRIDIPLEWESRQPEQKPEENAPAQAAASQPGIPADQPQPQKPRFEIDIPIDGDFVPEGNDRFSSSVSDEPMQFVPPPEPTLDELVSKATTDSGRFTFKADFEGIPILSDDPDGPALSMGHAPAIRSPFDPVEEELPPVPEREHSPYDGLILPDNPDLLSDTPAPLPDSPASGEDELEPDYTVNQAGGTPPVREDPHDLEIEEEPIPPEPEEMPDPPVYRIPPLHLLRAPRQQSDNDITDEMKANAQRLVDSLACFGVQTRIVDISRGTAVTRYELQPSAGVKISKITGLADDIALNLAAAGVRIEAPIPNKAAVGIEVPNKVISAVTIREIIDSDVFRDSESHLSAALGRDIAGNIAIADIGKMPHLLIAGSTGSGKSVCINSIIISLLFKSTPEEVRFLMIDPKVVELGIYNGIPQLLVPVVTDPKKAAGALSWAVSEMLKRYKLFADNSVRDLKSFNNLAARTEGMETLPQIVIIIDELADLMMAAPNEIEDSICRLAQMARAAGMHLVIATQRPSVDVITGVIKANIPSRIAFAVSSQIDSRTILDMGGAEKLLGRGDMLFNPVGSSKPLRVQGCFVTDEEIEAVIGFIKSDACALYDDEIVHQIDSHVVAGKGGKGGSNASSDAGGPEEGEEDEMLMPAIECVVEAGMASTSLLQRRLKLGYARAARIVDEMETRGIVGPFEGSKPRQVLITPERWAEMKLSQDN